MSRALPADMTHEKISRRLESVAFALSRILGLPLLLLPLAGPVLDPVYIVRADYPANLYSAARLVLQGRAHELYPRLDATSFLDAPLNAFAHQILPALPAADVAVFMYSPLVAGLLAPFALLAPTLSMLAWQAASVAAVTGSAALLARATGRTFADEFWTSLLYLPIFQTLLIGHLGLVLGLLPLAAGYALVSQGRPVLGGLVWSFIALKPQFAPAPLLVAAALTLVGRVHCLLGLAVGTASLGLVSVVCFSPDILLQWLHALRLADQIFSDPSYRYPTYLVTSLPAVILHWLPHDLRTLAKVPSYLLAAFVGLAALWSSRRLLRSSFARDGQQHPGPVFLLGLAAIPIVVPHLLSYDLAVLAIAGSLMRTTRSMPGTTVRRLTWIAWLYVAVIDVFLVQVMLLDPRSASPTLLTAALVALYVAVVSTLETTNRPNARSLSAS